MKSMTSKRSAEILTSVATEIHLQLQNAESQIQTDVYVFRTVNFKSSRTLFLRSTVVIFSGGS